MASGLLKSGTVFIQYLILVCLSFRIINGRLEDLQITVKEPIHTTGPDIALIIIPQSNVDALQYEDLGNTLQTTANTFRLWVGYIGGWDDGIANLLQMDQGFLLMLRRLYELGLAQHAPVMVAGHGYGGGSLFDYVDLHPNMFQGLVMLSRDLPSFEKMTDLTLPTLFLSGDLDGVMTVFSAARLFQRLVNELPTAPQLVWTTPVVTLEGVNHTHYFSGPIPENLTKVDIEGEIGYSQAWSDISHVIVPFLIVHSNLSQLDIPSAKQVLQDGFNDNQNRMGNIWVVQAMDQNDDGHSPWTETSQTHLVGLTGQSIDQLQVSSDVVSEFALPGKRATASLQNGTVFVETYAEVSRPRDSSKTNVSLTPTQLQSKMIRKSVILKLLPNATSDGKNLTCRDINKLCFETARQQASNIAQKRFSVRGRPIITKPDIATKTGVDWILKQLLLEYSNDGLYVTSYSLITPDNFIIKSLAGAFYCKLLAPSRALEWIYVDSLRGSKANS